MKLTKQVLIDQVADLFERILLLTCRMFLPGVQVQGFSVRCFTNSSERYTTGEPSQKHSRLDCISLSLANSKKSQFRFSISKSFCSHAGWFNKLFILVEQFMDRDVPSSGYIKLRSRNLEALITGQTPVARHLFNMKTIWQTQCQLQSKSPQILRWEAHLLEKHQYISQCKLIVFGVEQKTIFF